jgi:molybdopterin-synthase adenylyltransferase
MTADRDFSRQSFLGPTSEATLAAARVAIVGCGGGGSHIAQQLAHLGVGHYRLIDPQAIEASNLNRLVGATTADVDAAAPKIEIVRRTILGVRPWAEVRTAQRKWQEADTLLKDAHVVFGCVDGYQQRDYREAATRRFGVPYIDIGMDVTALGDGAYAVAGQMIATRPGQPCMRCLGFLTSERLSREENRYGDVGINPQVVWTNGMPASVAVGAFVQLMTPWFKVNSTYAWLELDGNKQTVSPSQQPKYALQPGPCPHYAGADSLGDPFFNLANQRVSE